MFAPWFWFAILGLLFCIAEVFTASFFALPAGLAFLVTAAVSPLLPDLSWAMGLLAALLLLTYTVSAAWIWPAIRRHKPPVSSGALGMIGQLATVTEDISADGERGYVKLYGDRWRAVGTEEFAAGTKVKILSIDGNKVKVGVADGRD